MSFAFAERFCVRLASVAEVIDPRSAFRERR
jgi:hypothetical protein